MKRTDKYPPPTPEDVARVEACGPACKVHPLLWVVLAVVVVIGVGLYSDLVGFYEFEELEEMITEEEHKDENTGDQDTHEVGESNEADEPVRGEFGKRGWLPDRTYAPADGGQ